MTVVENVTGICTYWYVRWCINLRLTAVTLSILRGAACYYYYIQCIVYCSYFGVSSKYFYIRHLEQSSAQDKFIPCVLVCNVTVVRVRLL